MKQKLLKIFMLTFLGVGGASVAWADNFSPTFDYTVRMNGTNDGYSWFKNSDGEFELKQSARIFGLQTYTVTNLAAAKKITLVLKGGKSTGTDASAIWVFTKNDWTTSTSASDMETAFSNTTGVTHGSTGTTTSTYLMINTTSNRSTTGDVQTCNFEISGEKLAKLKSVASDNTFTLLITNAVSDVEGNKDTQRKYYSSANETETCRPYVAVDYDPIVLETNSTISTHTTLNAAFDAITSSGTITLYDDVTITSLCDVKAKTISVVAAKDGISVSSTLNNSLWILSGNSASNLTFGSDDHTITIDGGNISNSSNTVEAGQGTTTFKNVVFKNCKSTHNFGITCLKGGGKLHLNNVTFDGCTANEGWGIVFAGNNELYLENNISFTNCDAYNIYLENKFARVGNLSSTLAAPLTVYYQTPSIGAVILSSSTGGDKSDLFQLMNENYGIVKNSNHHTDHVITEAYTMTVSDAGAATLIIPFDAKIPSGVKAYTLNYTTGNSNVKATEVTGGTLSANTPVLLNAESGKYWFINTTNVSAATANDGNPHTTGALVGVYTDTYCPANDYLLGNKNGVVAFYHPNGENTNYIRANRAYLHADGAGARVTISFDDETTTGIENVNVNLNDNKVYDLQGRRVALPTKGLFIVNGKKVVIK